MKLIFPLRQHIGVPSEPVVSTGTHVKRGQLIAKKPDASLGANIFSSVDGTVDSVNEAEIVINEENTDFQSMKSSARLRPSNLSKSRGW